MTVTDEKSAETARLHAKYLSRGRAKIAGMLGGQIEESSAGSYIHTSAGEKYLNCAGYGVMLLGATHPDVVEAVVEQVRRHPISSRVFFDDVTSRAAQALAEVCPGELEKVFFCGSGAEAVETALKLARVNGHKRTVTTRNGYHGRTMGALSVSAKRRYQEPFEPLIPDVVEIPFGDANALRAALRDAEPSCFIVEPIQGEAGVVIPDDDYLPEVSRICQEHDCFLIVDEVLTGMGRTGTWWAISELPVQPDVMLVGKGLSGGVVPVSAAVATPTAYAPFDKDPILHASTFGGSPIQTAAVLAAIEATKTHDVLGAAGTIGERLLRTLRTAAQAAPPGSIREVRGKGLLLGVEFEDPGSSAELMLHLLDRGVLINHSVNNPHVVRFTPPALMSEDEVDTLEVAMEDSFRQLGKLSVGRR
ncbi:aminotransferase class III-fold pyridoxal phosphate-dependent enzyme [Streptomyces luomodiensis]|uniref:Aminotransferase class III-fold pyridoxal phosphate-dependent enzyme n=1 Tax=Streptomyces luomodiensis TaxID=3026192 RepID=A0ABY9V7S5_9ACTN|nr:aminotransferase class III-fold pyridoxal phosphate-dependent enzyme [Streptomyces sp. SCA4-21]WNF00874.1 aminotransferase class III-fold pyridoxal phosphate-dependent enzyme [Streptomyces sp. SCA4-21]